MEAINQKRWRDLTDISERDRAHCTVAEKLSAAPTDMAENDWRPLRDLGFGGTECLDVGHMVGIFNYLTRLADGFGMKLDAKTGDAVVTGKALQRLG